MRIRIPDISCTISRARAGGLADKTDRQNRPSDTQLSDKYWLAERLSKAELNHRLQQSYLSDLTGPAGVSDDAAVGAAAVHVVVAHPTRAAQLQRAQLRCQLGGPRGSQGLYLQATT